MIKLVHSSDYTEYTAGVYPDVAACVQDCVQRYGMSRMDLGQDDAGALYSVLYGDEGIVVLRLYEVEEAGVL